MKCEDRTFVVAGSKKVNWITLSPPGGTTTNWCFAIGSADNGNCWTVAGIGVGAKDGPTLGDGVTACTVRLHIWTTKKTKDIIVKQRWRVNLDWKYSNKTINRQSSRFFF